MRTSRGRADASTNYVSACAANEPSGLFATRLSAAKLITAIVIENNRQNRPTKPTARIQTQEIVLTNDCSFFPIMDIGGRATEPEKYSR